MSKSKNIKAARVKKGISQKELGNLTGIAESTIRRYELGSLNPKIETLQKIAIALDTSLFELLDGDFTQFSSEELRRAWNTDLDSVKANKKKKELINFFDQLNIKGQDKALESVEILTKVDKFKKANRK